MPHQVIACSPGCMPAADDEHRRIAELAKRDPMIPASFCDTLLEAMKDNDPDVCTYMLSNNRATIRAHP